MAKIVWTDSALQFLRTQVRERNKVQDLVKVVEHLSLFPSMYPRVRSGHFPGCRVITSVEPFVVIYRMVGGESVESCTSSMQGNSISGAPMAPVLFYRPPSACAHPWQVRRAMLAAMVLPPSLLWTETPLWPTIT